MTGTCAVSWCPEDRVEGAMVCGSTGNHHLDDLWAGRLRLLSDGTYILTAGPQPRWLARQANPVAEGNTMNRLDRDETGSARGLACPTP